MTPPEQQGFEFSKASARRPGRVALGPTQKNIRFSYGNTLDATARLFAFVNSKPMLHASMVSERQARLALSDLVVFALHAKRLIKDLDLVTYAKIIHVSLQSAGKSQNIWKLLSVIIHSDYVEIVTLF
jgi:hypothetical protein